MLIIRNTWINCVCKTHIFLIWAFSSRCATHSPTHTIHTNTSSLYVLFYFLLHVSAIHTDHHQVEIYRYRRKSATLEPLLQHFSFCTCIFLPDGGQYVWPKHIVEYKRIFFMCCVCVCGLYFLVESLNV